MSGRPYTYGRGMAIAKLMQDIRRPALQAIVNKNKEWHDLFVKRRDESGLKYHVSGPHPVQTIYLYGEELFTSYSDTIDWVPKLSKLTKYGRHAHYLSAEQIASEQPDNPEQFPQYYSDILHKQLYIDAIEGWPTEAEIAAEIAESAEREKRWRESYKKTGSLGLSLNDLDTMKRTIG
jgi:hypothetical protein